MQNDRALCMEPSAAVAAYESLQTTTSSMSWSSASQREQQQQHVIKKKRKHVSQSSLESKLGFCTRSLLASTSWKNISLTPMQRKMLELLTQRSRLACDIDNDLHHRTLLSEYWTFLFPYIDCPSLPNDLWKLAGFQSGNPATDFRGGGSLSLQCMHYFASHHPKSLVTILKDCLGHDYETTLKSTYVEQGVRKDNESLSSLLLASSDLYYPFSAAFVNVAFALYSLLGLNRNIWPSTTDLTSTKIGGAGGGKCCSCCCPESTPKQVEGMSPAVDGQLARNSASAWGKSHGVMGVKSRRKILIARNFSTLYLNHEGKPDKHRSAAFERLFCAAAIRLHREWKLIARTGNLLGFGEALEKTIKAVENTLLKKKIRHASDLLEITKMI